MNGAKFSESLLAIAEELRGLTATARLTADLAAPKLSQNVQDEFTAGEDPTGNAWAPLKSGGASHLDKTGSMRSKLQVSADGLIVRGKLAAPANIHQYGSKSRQSAHQQAALRAAGLVRDDGGFVPTDARANRARARIASAGIPARPIFPMPDKPLPESWDASLTEAAHEAFEQLTTKMQSAK